MGIRKSSRKIQNKSTRKREIKSSRRRKRQNKSTKKREIKCSGRRKIQNGGNFNENENEELKNALKKYTQQEIDVIVNKLNRVSQSQAHDFDGLIEMIAEEYLETDNEANY